MISFLPAQQKPRPSRNILCRQIRSFMLRSREHLPWSTSDGRFGKQTPPLPFSRLASRSNRHFSKDKEDQ